MAMEENFKHFREIMTTIYSYGSAKSIEVVFLMQKENYAANGGNISLDKYRMLSSYALLSTQIKYDLTEISVSSELWFQMRLTDLYSKKRRI